MANHKKHIPVGKRFHRLVVLETGHVRGKHHLSVNCKCDCGTIKLIRLNVLEHGQVSCGCHTKERNKLLNTKHGMYYSPIYQVWTNMISRCHSETDPAYQHYGGRGITVCDRWHDVRNFVEDMLPSYKKGLTIDRINNDDGYYKDNCRWATKAQQNLNRRTNIRYTYNGENLTLKELSDKYHVPYLRAYKRVRIRGWDISDALKS